MSGNSSGDDKQTLVRKNDAEGFGPRRMWFWLSTLWKKISISIHTFVRDNFVLASFSIALALYYVIPKLDSRGSKLASYSDLIKGIRNDTVKELQFEENSERIFYNTKSTYNVDSKSSSPSFYYRDKKGNPRTIQEYQDRHQWQYYTIGFESSHCEIRDKISKSGNESNIRYSVAPQSVLMVMRTALISSLHNCRPLDVIMDNFIHRWVGFTKSNPKLTANSCGMVKFEDVQGVDAAKTELLEIVACLRGDSTYRKLGAKLPRGVLLMGPPGTGKTLIARAMAGEARVPFFSISASEFVELYVGVGAGRIRDLFTVARKCAPSIIFIDEIDCIGGQRREFSNSERDQTLNQLLTEMDGFDERNRKVVVIAATNRAEILDPALRRPGRFTRKILVGKPNEDGRRKILAVHLRGIPLEEDTQLVCDLVASLTQGLVGADLANIANEATLLAARRGGECVSREDIMSAVERVQSDAINGQSDPESNEVGH